MRLIALAFAFLMALASYGSLPADSVKVFFRMGQSRFDPSLDDNGEAMDNFLKRLQEADTAGDIDSIVVKAYTSPDGTSVTNATLSRQRCEAIAELIARRSGVGRDFIRTSPEGIAWDELRRLVAANPDVPARQKILDILENTPILVFDARGKIIDGRKKQLMDLNGGRPYKWMFANLFPLMRNSVAVAVFRKQRDNGMIPESCVEDFPQAQTEPETSMGSESGGSEPEIPTSRDDFRMPSPDSGDRTDTLLPQSRGDSPFALKTNLLYYAVLMPNLEIEWMAGRRWSAALEVQGAWWSKESPHKVYRLATLIPEARFWAIQRARWHGMYVGVFFGGGLYDLSNGKKGHEGEGFMTGISAGYMWPISKHLSFDAGIGVGYMRARDKEYMPLDGHFLYQLTKNINYFGPLRLRFSLVWRIPR